MPEDTIYFTPVYQCDRQKLVIIGHFFPFIPCQKKSEF